MKKNQDFSKKLFFLKLVILNMLEWFIKVSFNVTGFSP